MSSRFLKTETARWAEQAAKDSGLPGYRNGPGDAYRHILWIAETARTTGTLPAWAQGEANELRGVLSNPPEETSMDRYNNNEIALRIARMATSREDVERLAQAEIVAAHLRSGTGADGTAQWLDRSTWGHPADLPAPTNWPPKWDNEDELRVERLLTLPIEEWEEHHLRLVVASRIYHDRNHPKHAMAQDAAQRWLHATDARRMSILRSTFGPVTVDPYTRGDGTQVEGHTRAAPKRP
jgi:hypothetical protein